MCTFMIIKKATKKLIKGLLQALVKWPYLSELWIVEIRIICVEFTVTPALLQMNVKLIVRYKH